MIVTSTFTIYEILEKASIKKTHQEKVDTLTYLRCNYMEEFIDIVFNKKLKFSFDIVRPKSLDVDSDVSYVTLKSQLKKLIAISDIGVYKDIPKEKRSKMMSNIMDGLSKKESNLLMMIIKDKFKFKGLDIRILKHVYSDIINSDK